MPESYSQRSSVLHGPLKYIVRSAHKWGGNGRKPDFNKIKRVLMSKHPEVIAKVFGGKPDVAAAWIKDAWYRYYGIRVKGKTGAGPTYWRGEGRVNASMEDFMTDMLLEFQEVERALFEDEELFLDSSVASKDGELVWLEATRTGTWKKNPIAGEQGPLVIDEQFLRDTISNFEDGAWEHVTVPLTHADKVDENTGQVLKFRIAKHPRLTGEKVLLAGVKFADKEVEEKVIRGAILGRSGGWKTNGHVRVEDGKIYETPVMKHLALTNKPWVNGLAVGAVDPENYLAASQLDFDVVVDEQGAADLERMIETMELSTEDELEFLESASASDLLLDVVAAEDTDLLLQMLDARSRKEWAKKGIALPDGSFPIPNIAFLRKAIQAFGRAVAAGKGAQVKRHIVKRAKALKATHLIPDKWSTANYSQIEYVDGDEDEALLHLERVGQQSDSVDGESGPNDMPAEARYRVADTKAYRCQNCEYFDDGNSAYAGMGYCVKWDAPAEANHVSSGFQAVSASFVSMSQDDRKIVARIRT